MKTNFEQLEKIFPEVITEKLSDGKIIKAVDFDKLKDILSENISDALEHYEFSWVGKKIARANAFSKIDKTLRPCPEESKNFFATENLYIEGDNLEVLKLLQQSYLHKVKFIYIDPPYNTGNDFIYRDKFRKNDEEIAEETALFDDDGNKNFRENPESNPRFHSDWCSMIYSRLLLARNLLTDDGVIFISIDDNEQANLKKICDEVFGERNFVGFFFRKTKSGGGSASGTCAVEHDYIFCFAKNLNSLTPLTQKFSDEYLERYKEKDSRGVYFWDTMERSSTKTRPYVIVAPDGTKLTGKWFRSEETFKKDLQDGEVRFLKKNDGWSVQFKQRLAEGKKLRTILDEEDFTDKKFRSLSDELEEIVGCSLGHPPKSVLLMKTLIDSVCKNSSSDIILDFFSGSATTAHAVMQLNAEDGGRRKFIMVQWPEKCAEKSEAFKAGYKNICEIGKKRIRCAGEKIKSESPLTTGNLDTGFRVLKVDETNFKNISVSPAELTQEMLKDFADNIKPDRNGLDLVFECLINWGVELHLPYAQEEFDGATIHIYDEDSLMACFDKNISLEVVKHMAKKKPLRAVFCDGCFSRDDEKINASEIFKLYAPNSNFKVV